MFIEDDDVSLVIFAAKEDGGVMSPAVVHGSPPFAGVGTIEVGDDMNVAAKVGEELSGGDVPIAVEPGAFLPAGEVLESAGVIRIGEFVVGDGGGDEAGVVFRV